jgi:cytochrome c553
MGKPASAGFFFIPAPRTCMRALVSCLLVALAPGAHAAVDLAVAAEKAQACFACHGPGGISQTAETPSLAGQPELYLQWQLVFFRSGQRKSPVMQPMAESMKDDDIRNLAAYFSKQAPPRADPAARPDDALLAAGMKVVRGNRCTSCHRDDFSGTQATARVAWQREDYLLKALRDFKAGRRIGGGVAAMSDVVQPLQDEDLKAVAHFLAHLPS